MVALKDKFFGCIAGSWIGSAMGAAVEGWEPDRIKATYGYVDRLYSYRHYASITDWQRMPGTTEDGIERQKLICTAIIEKQDVIRSDDLVRIWHRDLDVEKMIYKTEKKDRCALELSRAGVSPIDLGRMNPFSYSSAISRSTQPLGLINAGDPKGAADTTFEVCRVYGDETSHGVRWAAVVNAAIAEACRPGATVQSVLEAARSYARYRSEAVGAVYANYENLLSYLDRALEIANRHGDAMELRDEFYTIYNGGGNITYGRGHANEVVPKAMAIFAFAKGDPGKTLTIAANFGRDTDCLDAVASALAGALSGPSTIPAEWIREVEAATAADPYTNNKRTMRETAEGLYAAFRARLARLRRHLDSMDQAG